MTPAEVITNGTRLGNYIIQEKIGQGAFSQVWRAVHHERPGKVVAVKIATAPEFRRQLAREGLMPAIEHPNIVPILDSDTQFSDYFPYVVMPYFPRGSLQDLLRQHPAGLPEPLVKSRLIDILSGLTAAHEAGIVHRDLKPANILIDASDRALIADFGLSVYKGSPDALRTMIQSGSLSMEQQHTIAGTLAYMAPEVSQGGPATPASDVYALGLMLFEMLVGRLPRGLELPSRVRPDLKRPSYWDSLFYWSQSPPQDRYPNASAMAAAFRQGPSPIPILPTLATSRAGVIDRPRPLPDDLWQALALCWDQRARIIEQLAQHRKVIDQALEIYTENHHEVRKQREHEADLESALNGAGDRLAGVWRQIDGELERQLEPALKRRDELLDEGCRPNHPDVIAIERSIAPPQQIRSRLSALMQATNIRMSPSTVPAVDSSHVENQDAEESARPARDNLGRFAKKADGDNAAAQPLLRCLLAWIPHMRALELGLGNRQSLLDFVKRYGRDQFENPWAPGALAAVRRMHNRVWKRSAWLVGAGVLLIGLPGLWILDSMAKAERARDARRLTVPALMLELQEIDDPVEVGANTTYIIRVTNQGFVDITHLAIECIVPDQQELIKTQGATTLDSRKNPFRFKPLPRLAPKAKAEYRLTVKCKAPGDVRFRATVISDQTKTPIDETESTRIY